MTQRKYFMSAFLPSPILPVDRTDRFEDPLDDVLDAERLGRVVGGASYLNADRDIVQIEVRFWVHDVDVGVALSKRVLEGQGAPVDSKIIYDSGNEQCEVLFGCTRGIVLHVNGTDLPSRVYEKYGMDDIWQGLRPLLESARVGEIHGERTRDEDTELYIFGCDPDEMRATIEPFVSTHPLCQRARSTSFMPDAESVAEIVGGDPIEIPELSS